MPGRRSAQRVLWETEREDPELEAALRNREAKAEARSSANHNFKVADDNARKLIDALDLGEGAAVRVGDYLITAKTDKGRNVDFKVDPQMRIRIKPLKT